MASIDQLRDQKVRELVRGLVPAAGTVLEVSCGPAAMLAQLRKDGFDVRGTNFTAYPDADPAVAIDNGVDVMQGLPYEDAAFDCVIFLDVFEHLRDHDAALMNAARVLKPGGHLILVSPNICNLASRLHFLWTGFFKIRRSFVGFDLPASQAFAFHNYPPHLPVLLYQMHAYGMPMARFDAVGVKFKSLLFYVLLWPLVAAATYHRTRRQEKFLAGTPAGKMLHRTLTSFACLTGEAMIVTGRRSDSPPEPVASARTHMPAWFHGPGSGT